MIDTKRTRPTAKILVAIVAALLFAALAFYIRLFSPALDASAEGFFGPYANPFVDQLATDVTAMGGSVVAITFALTVSVVLLLVGHRKLATLLSGGVVGGSLLAPSLKLLFNRPRPSVIDSPVFYASGSSFPSGHSTTGTVLMVLLAYVIHRLAGGRRAVSAAAAFLAAALIASIGTSRVYLGVHHPTDVAGGILIGILWATLCIIMAGRDLVER